MNSKKIMIVAGLVTVLLSGVLVACSTPDQKESNLVRNQQQLYIDSQPPPYFDWSLERQLMTELYKARNRAVSTFSLTWDPYRGKISWSCPSIGFPIPGGTQLTNPEQTASNSVAIPQAEPNGLFSPATSAGTYVMCINSDGTVSPTYVEDNVRTFPQPMEEVNGRLMPVNGTTPSLKISPNKPASGTVTAPTVKAP